jgi:hypothetical protein
MVMANYSTLDILKRFDLPFFAITSFDKLMVRLKESMSCSKKNFFLQIINNRNCQFYVIFSFATILSKYFLAYIKIARRRLSLYINIFMIRSA